MKFNFSICLCFWLFVSNGQWKERFQTGIDNDWIGDRSNFIVNANQQLQLSAPTAGMSIFLHPFNNSDSLVWIFYFKMEFAASLSNRMTILLMTDRLNQDSANAYMLEIGENGNNDNWKFYVKQSSSKILLGEGELTKLAGDPAEARMSIQKNADNSWIFSVDYSINSQFTLERIIQSVPQLNIALPLFGFQCFYTDTRKDKFFIDDICIGPPFNDLDPPELISAVVVSDYKLQIRYNEPVDNMTSLNLKNYLLDGTFLPVKAARIAADLIDLEFPKKFIPSKNYHLQYDSIRDLKANLALGQFFDFISGFSIQPNSLDILITEFMADPTPVVGLPEKEFVEIKNISKQKLNLADCILTDGTTQSKLPKYILDSDAYLIVCYNKDTQDFKTFGSVLGLDNFPSLNNTGDLISLRNKDHEIIHEINFDDSWYRSSLKKEGGYSLEMINTGNPCAGKENWIASRDFSGGTPGKKNSVEVYQKDFSGPQILDAYPLNEFEIKLIFNEKLYKINSSDVHLFSITPFHSISSVELVSPLDNELILVLNEALEKGIQYKVSIQLIADCLGNTSSLESNVIALPSEPVSRDLVWSEVLFNPYSGGSDFIELYNRSNKVLSLNKLMIKNRALNDSWYPVSSDRIILPGSYIAFTVNPENVLHTYWKSDSSKIIKTQIPSIDDAGGSLQLAYNQNNSLLMLDSFSFSKSWHHPFIHDVEGVSLEKINMETASDNRNNWQSAASSFGYATPGLANSHFIDTSGDNQNKPYTLSSRIISPNGDSYRDFLTISFNLMKPGYKSRIEIYDLSGQKRKSVSYAVLSSQDLIVWNGDDDLGSILPIGNYILYIELLHPDGDQMKFKERLVVDH